LRKFINSNVVWPIRRRTAEEEERGLFKAKAVTGEQRARRKHLCVSPLSTLSPLAHIHSETLHQIIADFISCSSPLKCPRRQRWPTGCTLGLYVHGEMAGHISQEAADRHARRTPARRPWGACATSLPTLQGLVRTTRPRRENVKRWGHRNCAKSLSRLHTNLLSRLHANLPVQHVGIKTSTTKTQKVFAMP
jgi:hypothetical protein